MYVEQIKALFITLNSKQLVLIGHKHHYIFDVVDAFKFAATLPENRRIETEFNNFTISEDHTISGNYRFTIKQSDLLTAESES